MTEETTRGRPVIHDLPERHCKFRATPEEWTRFLALKGSNTRQSFLRILMLLERDEKGEDCTCLSEV